MHPSNLLLSFYPNTRGFGFVLFEGPLSPFDWGVKEVRGPNKARHILSFLGDLIDRYKPAVLVLEDWTDDTYRRIDRICSLYESIVLLAKKKGIPVITYPWRKVREYFLYRNAITKYDIAIHIARMIPAFSYQIPTPRKPWTATDTRQLLYDAAALGTAQFSEWRTPTREQSAGTDLQIPHRSQLQR